MKKRMLILGLVLCVALQSPLSVFATTKSEAQAEKNRAQENLNAVNNKIGAIEADKEELEEEIVEIDAQLVDLLLAVDLITDDIDNKQLEINDAQADYEEAKAKEENQYESMKKRIKFMYEKGDTKYLEMFLESKSIAEIINKSDYVEMLYDYDRQLLLDYQQTKEEVAELKVNLENEKSELVEMQDEYVTESEALEELINQKKSTLDNFDAQLSAAKSQASKYQSQIKKQTEVLRQIEAEEAAAKKKAEEEAKKKALEAKKKAEAEAKKKAEEEAKKNEESKEESEENTDNQNVEEEAPAQEENTQPEPEQPKEEKKESSGSSSGGSAKGSEIANFACKYVGNPYVPGGTSLTNGADCSGFTYAVYKNFGYSIPRNSYAQSTYGREVSYSEAQPGDIIYYGGHVGIYIGGGKIVHASTQATGIKISSALYRSIITVRRII